MTRALSNIVGSPGERSSMNSGASSGNQIRMGDSVTVRIDAPLSDVWQLLSDITRFGELSPETIQTAEWIDGANGPAEGARFRRHIRRNQKSASRSSLWEVTECDFEQSFAFALIERNKRRSHWRYELGADGPATNLTLSYFLEPTLLNRINGATSTFRFFGWPIRRRLKSMLERMRPVLESPHPPEHQRS